MSPRMNASSQELNKPIPATRIAVSIPLKLQFLSLEGEALGAEILRGHTRDISNSGLSLEISDLPEGLAATLESTDGKLKVAIDARLGRKDVRLSGQCAWTQVVRRGLKYTCLCAVSLSDPQSNLAAALYRRAQELKRRPKIVAGVAATVAIVLAAVIGFTWRSWALRSERVQLVEAELNQTIETKRTLAEELDLARQALRTARNENSLPQSELLEKEQNLEELRQRFEHAQVRVGELAVALANLTGTPPENQAERANYHLDRGHFFSRRDNLAAALMEYEQAVLLNPSIAEAQLEIGTINELYGRNEQAVVGYEKYLELRPKAIDAYEIRENINNIKELLASNTSSVSE